MLQYFGVYVPSPAETVVSPNGDGAAEEQRLSFKVVRPSTVTTTLTAPGGAVAFQESLARQPGTYDVAFPPVTAAPQPVPPTEPAALAEGRCSRCPRPTTRGPVLGDAALLGELDARVPTDRADAARPPARRGERDDRLDAVPAARARVTVETPDGIVIRTAAARRFEPGTPAVVWNGRLANGKLAPGGRYVVRVTATNEVGTVDLTGLLTVRRTAKPKR